MELLHDSLLAMLAQATELWHDRLKYRETAELTAEIITLIKTIQPPTPETDLLLARALSIRGSALLSGGSFEESLTSTVAALALFEAVGHEADLIDPLLVYGQLLFQTSEYSSALEQLYRAAVLAERYGPLQKLAQTYMNLGTTLVEYGDHANAHFYLQRLLDMLGEVNDPIMAASAFNNVGYGLHRIGFLDEALISARQSLALFTQSDRAPGLSVAHGTIGDILMDKGEWDEAEGHFLESLRQAERFGRKGQGLWPQGSLALLYAKRGHTSEALLQAHHMLTIAIETNEHIHIQRGHEMLATIYEQVGDYASALRHQKGFSAVQSVRVNEQTAARIQRLLVLHRTDQMRTEADQQRRLREQDRVYYEKLGKLRKSLMDAAAHDMKGPLTTIRITAQLLREHLHGNDERIIKWLNRIEASTQQSHGLILRLLDLVTGHELSEMADIDLGPIVEACLSDFQAQADYKGVRLEKMYPAVPAAPLCGDAMQLQQVMNNLLLNAIKYTDPAGVVTVRMETNEGEASVHVQDTGIGIPAADLPQIFEPSFRAGNVMHREGTGLGLAIVKAIVEQHGGRVWVDSIEGQGSTFGFALPMAKTV